MEGLLKGLTGGGGLDPSMLAALQRQTGGRGNPMNQLLSSLSGNMAENSAMAALAARSVRPSKLYGPGVSETEDFSAWTLVYPHYIAAEKSYKDGRRINREFAVANPVSEEVAEAAGLLGLRYVYEDKCYPRDFLLRGRVRIELKRPSGELVNPDIPYKSTLLMLLAQEVPNTSTRRRRLAEETRRKSAAEEAAQTKQAAKSAKKKKAGGKKR